MMHLFISILLLYNSIAFAQYEQVVKPVQIEEIVSFSQYQLRQAMNQFFKTSSSSVLSSSTTLQLQAPMLCLNSELDTGDVELFLVRSNFSLPSKVLQIRETLFLKACGRRFELYNLERQGKNIVATADAHLLRADLPNVKDTQLYRLELMDRAIKIEILSTQSEQKMNFSLSYGGNYEMQAQITDLFTEEKLTHQYVKTFFSDDGRIFEDLDSEYIWRLDPKHKVPRQYLYSQKTEISPADYLKIKDSIFNKNAFPLIERAVKFGSFAL